MRITVKTEQLKNSLNKILSVVDKKNTRPILGYTLISAKEGALTLSATDLEIGVKIVIDAEVEGEGSFCINAKNLFDIVRELPQEDILLKMDEGQRTLQLLGEDIFYSLLIYKDDEFPHLAFENGGPEFRLQSKQISEIINKTSHAISIDETRLNLNGIFLQEIDDQLRAVATDGHRLSLLDTPLDTVENEPLKGGIIVPRRSIQELKKISETFPDKELKISVDDSFMYVIAEGRYFLSIRLIAREYPKYNAVIPNKTVYTMVTDRNIFFNAIRRIKIMSNEKSNGVKVELTEKQMTITANHPSLGEAREKIPIQYDGNEIEIGFNAKYLIDTISTFDDGEISLELNNELSPVIVKAQNNSEHLGIIMPLKL